MEWANEQYLYLYMAILKTRFDLMKNMVLSFLQHTEG